MTLPKKIQQFLYKKLFQLKLTRKAFAQECGLPYTSLINLINATQTNPALNSLLKIANYLNCSIDEMVGRKKYVLKKSNEIIQFQNLTIDDYNTNLRNFICHKMQQHNLPAYKLGLNIGFSAAVIDNFVNQNRKNIQSNLGTAPIVALADYFAISVDEMIGRISRKTLI